MRRTLIHGRVYGDSSSSLNGLWAVDPDGAVVMDDGYITQVLPTTVLQRQESHLGSVWDVEGRAVVPGFIDCHTHLPFAGWRSDEYLTRLEGTSYESLSRGHGGIARSSQQWVDASDEEIVRLTEALAQEALGWGTTVLEMKTGYGLSVAQELRALHIIRQLAGRLPQRVVATGLFLHAPPPSMSKAQWLETVKTVLLPEALEAGLISQVDAFVERTAFSAEEVDSVFQGIPADLPIRLHTNQFSQIGGIELATRLQARSVEHLECLSADEMDTLKIHGIAAVVMPGAAFYGGASGYAPARQLLERRIPLALATDLNPGSSPVGNLPTVMALAVNLMQLTPDEALAGVTRWAAYVLGLDHVYGSIRPGNVANLVVLDSNSIVDIPYRIGHNPVHQVILNGRDWSRRSDAVDHANDAH